MSLYLFEALSRLRIIATGCKPLQPGLLLGDRRNLWAPLCMIGFPLLAAAYVREGTLWASEFCKGHGSPAVP